MSDVGGKLDALASGQTLGADLTRPVINDNGVLLNGHHTAIAYEIAYPGQLSAADLRVSNFSLNGGTYLGNVPASTSVRVMNESLRWMGTFDPTGVGSSFQFGSWSLFGTCGLGGFGGLGGMFDDWGGDWGDDGGGYGGGDFGGGDRGGGGE